MVKILIGVIICFTIVLPIFALAKSAGLADRRLEEIQRKAAEREAGNLNGN